MLGIVSPFIFMSDDLLSQKMQNFELNLELEENEGGILPRRFKDLVLLETAEGTSVYHGLCSGIKLPDPLVNRLLSLYNLEKANYIQYGHFDGCFDENAEDLASLLYEDICTFGDTTSNPSIFLDVNNPSRSSRNSESVKGDLVKAVQSFGRHLKGDYAVNDILFTAYMPLFLKANKDSVNPYFGLRLSYGYKEDPKGKYGYSCVFGIHYVKGCDITVEDIDLEWLTKAIEEIYRRNSIGKKPSKKFIAEVASYLVEFYKDSCVSGE